MTKKTKCLLGIAGSMLAASSLYAGYSETFETTNVSAKPEAWSDGWVTNLTYSYSGIAGRPVAAESSQYFVIEGDATCTPTGGTFTGAPLVDMMVQVARPDDDLETPETGAYIAVAVDKTGKFNVYCKDRSGTGSAAWNQLPNEPYTDGTWVRVSLLFDYANGRCQVRLDGQPMMTANGYLDATTTDTTKNGAWYKLATATDSSSAVSSLKVVGCTAVDDVVIAANADNYAIKDNAKADGVPCAWFDKYGLAWNASATYGGTMTVGEKYARCFNPLAEDQTFELKSMSTTSEGVVLGLPTTVETEGREVVLDYGSDKTFEQDTTSTPVTGQQSVTIGLPATDGVIYYRLRARDNKTTGN
jgi:hypothetical protein